MGITAVEWYAVHNIIPRQMVAEIERNFVICTSTSRTYLLLLHWKLLINFQLLIRQTDYRPPGTAFYRTRSRLHGPKWASGKAQYRMQNSRRFLAEIAKKKNHLRREFMTILSENGKLVQDASLSWICVCMSLETLWSSVEKPVFTRFFILP